MFGQVNIVNATIRFVWPIHPNGISNEDSMDFSRGDGPCSDAKQVVMIEIETRADPKGSIFVYFYDVWAHWAQQFDQNSRISLFGGGIVAYFDESGDTQDQSHSLIVAAPHLTQGLNDTGPNAANDYIRIEYAKRKHENLAEDSYYHPVTMNNLLINTCYQVIIPPRARKSKYLNVCRGSFAYTKLSQVKTGSHCIYGAVVFASIPEFLTKTKNYKLTLRVLDETSEKPFQINVFSRRFDYLPQVKYVGDIVRFDHLNIKPLGSEIVGEYGANKRHHLTIRHDELGELEITTPTEPYTFAESDRQIIRDLTTWIRTCENNRSAVRLGSIERHKKIEELLNNDCCRYVDMIVKFVSITAPKGEGVFRGVIWDGTGSNTNVDIYFYVLWGLFKDRLVDDAWYHLRRVSVSNKDGKLTIGFETVSSLLLLSQISSRVQDASCGVQVPSITSSNVVTSEFGKFKVSEMLDAPKTPLISVLMNTEVPMEFRCQVRVAEIWPTQVKNIALKRLDSDEYYYMFVLRAEDETCSMDIIVYGEDAIEFFDGIQPCDLSTDSAALEKVQHKLKSILLTPNRLDCCIKSYKVDADTTRFRLCHTAICIESTPVEKPYP